MGGQIGRLVRCGACGTTGPDDEIDLPGWYAVRPLGLLGARQDPAPRRHFCSAGCLARWSADRAVSSEPRLALTAAS